MRRFRTWCGSRESGHTRNGFLPGRMVLAGSPLAWCGSRSSSTGVGWARGHAGTGAIPRLPHRDRRPESPAFRRGEEGRLPLSSPLAAGSRGRGQRCSSTGGSIAWRAAQNGRKKNERPSSRRCARRGTPRLPPPRWGWPGHTPSSSGGRTLTLPANGRRRWKRRATALRQRPGAARYGGLTNPSTSTGRSSAVCASIATHC